MGIAIFLVLAILLCSSVLSALSLFLLTCLFVAFNLIRASLLLSLLTLLVYLGALIVLFAYIWIYIPYLTSRFSPLWFFPAFAYLFSSCPCLDSSSLISYLYPSSLVLFLVRLLFWAIVVVVLILDLRQGGFSA